MADFLINPFLALILIAVICGMLGSFVLWKNLSYFGDAISHSMLLAIAIALVVKMNLWLAMLVIAGCMIIVIRYFIDNRYLKNDTILAITTYCFVALALLVADLNGVIKFNNYIFGEFLTANKSDVIALLLILVLTTLYLAIAFRKILLIRINEDLARIKNIKIDFWQISFLFLLSILIALAMQIVGVLLLTAMMIIPSAVARITASSPLQMIIISVVIGVVSAIAGFYFAVKFNLNASATMVVTTGLIFIVNNLIVKLKK